MHLPESKILERMSKFILLTDVYLSGYPTRYLRNEKWITAESEFTYSAAWVCNWVVHNPRYPDMRFLQPKPYPTAMRRLAHPDERASLAWGTLSWWLHDRLLTLKLVETNLSTVLLVKGSLVAILCMCLSTGAEVSDPFREQRTTGKAVGVRTGIDETCLYHCNDKCTKTSGTRVLVY